MDQPHLQHHQLFMDTISKLREELTHTRVAPVDMVFHFMAQSINAEYKNIVGTFKDDVKRVLQHLLYHHKTIPQAIQSAFPHWPRTFIGRVHLSTCVTRSSTTSTNVRTRHGHLHIPYTNPPAPQDIADTYRSIAHGPPHRRPARHGTYPHPVPLCPYLAPRTSFTPWNHAQRPRRVIQLLRRRMGASTHHKGYVTHRI